MAPGGAIRLLNRRRDNGLLAEVGQRRIVIHTVFAQHAAVAVRGVFRQKQVSDMTIISGTVAYRCRDILAAGRASFGIAAGVVWWEMPKVITERMPAFAIRFNLAPASFPGYAHYAGHGINSFVSSSSSSARSATPGRSGWWYVSLSP